MRRGNFQRSRRQNVRRGKFQWSRLQNVRRGNFQWSRPQNVRLEVTSSRSLINGRNSRILEKKNYKCTTIVRAAPPT